MQTALIWLKYMKVEDSVPIYNNPVVLNMKLLISVKYIISMSIETMAVKHMSKLRKKSYLVGT